jgi:hypothetical protein
MLKMLLATKTRLSITQNKTTLSFSRSCFNKEYKSIKTITHESLRVNAVDYKLLVDFCALPWYSKLAAKFTSTAVVWEKEKTAEATFEAVAYYMFAGYYISHICQLAVPQLKLARERLCELSRFCHHNPAKQKHV